MGKISRWFPPFCGVIFAVLFAVVAILIGSGEDATKKTAQEVVDHFKDRETRDGIAVVLIGFACVFILYFGGWLRRVLRDAEGPDGILSTVVFGAAVVFSAGAAIAGSVHLALVDLADDIDPVALQAINGIDYDMFFFFPVGLGTVILATGISALRHGALPRWFAWVSVVLGVLSFTPALFIGFLGAWPAWFAIAGIIGMRRAVQGEPSPAAA
jgi:hypothetical protein